MTPPTRKIFISYRRGKNTDYVKLIRERLIRIYGEDNVFLDTVSLPTFAEFKAVIVERIQECDAVLAIVDKDWARQFKERAERHEQDYVLYELEVAVERKKLIAPILIKNAEMPKPEILPEKIRPLCGLNAAELLSSGKYFEASLKDIIEDLEKAMNRRTEKPVRTEPAPTTPDDAPKRKSTQKTSTPKPEAPSKPVQANATAKSSPPPIQRTSRTIFPGGTMITPQSESVNVFDKPGGKVISQLQKGQGITVLSSNRTDKQLFVEIAYQGHPESIGWVLASEMQPSMESSTSFKPPSLQPTTSTEGRAGKTTFYIGQAVVTTAKAALVKNEGDRELLAPKIDSGRQLIVLKLGTAAQKNANPPYLYVFDHSSGDHGWTRSELLKVDLESSKAVSTEIATRSIVTPIHRYEPLWWSPNVPFDTKSLPITTSFQKLRVNNVKTVDQILWIHVEPEVQFSNSVTGWLRSFDVKLELAPKIDLFGVPLGRLASTRTSFSAVNKPASSVLFPIIFQGQFVTTIADAPKFMQPVILETSSSGVIPKGTLLTVVSLQTYVGEQWVQVKGTMVKFPMWIRAKYVKPFGK